jgi:probable lipoprotein NlpC
MKTKWSKYINIPFKDLGRDFSGVDCYGLIALIFKEEKGLVIPDYTELLYGKDRTEIKEKRDNILESMGIFWVKAEGKLKPFDALIFNRGCNSKVSSHVGLYIGNNKFIHVLENFPSYIEKLDNSVWKSRLYGAMRWLK